MPQGTADDKVGRRVLAAMGIVASVGIGLIIAEAALRVAGFEFGLYPTRVQVGYPDPGTLSVLYHLDRDLLWVPNNYAERLVPFKDKSPFVVFMGDSCTEFGRYDEFFAARVAERAPRADFSYANLAVAGWSSYEGLQQLKRDVLPLKPRYVTVLYGWNDHWASFGIEDKEIGRYDLAYPQVLMDLERFRLAQLLNKALLSLQHRALEGRRRPERVSLPDFSDNLTQIVRLARAQGVTPVLLTAPSAHRGGAEPPHLKERWLNDLDDLLPLHRRYVQAVRDVAAAEHAPLIDLYEDFQQLPREQWSVYFKQDQLHFTDDGGRRVADYLYEWFDAEGAWRKHS